MYLSKLKLWNFRKYGGKGAIVIEQAIREADLEVNFKQGLNVLIGENDSGKTAIIDAIKLILKTHSAEWIKVEDEDFFKQEPRLRIECVFEGLKDEEAMHFTEWLAIKEEGAKTTPYLRLILDIQRTNDRILPFEVKAGVDDLGHSLPAEAKDYLKTTYLRPLRDAESELIPKKNSRLSQVLLGHEIFKDKTEKDKHHLEKITNCLNCLIQKYFDNNHSKCSKEKCDLRNYFNLEIAEGKILNDNLNKFIQSFLGKKNSCAKFAVSSANLKNILEDLKLRLNDENAGLGSHNLLFMALELLNLERTDWTGLRLALIEELEAHLHPQAQLRVIEYLQELVDEKDKDIQIILTTHSPNLASKIKLENLIMCYDKQVFPMGAEYTKLDPKDYKFLEKFLDVTKSNLFFAKGVILVEGWAEEILLPALAKKLKINLVEKGVSIVNIGNTAFSHYAKIFQRRNESESMKIPVAVIRDLDIKPDEENQPDEKDPNKTKKQVAKESKESEFSGAPIEIRVSPHWTLEYCLSKSTSLNKEFKKIVKEVHSGTDWSNFDNQLKEKLENRSFKKTEIAYKLADVLESDENIVIKDDDENIKYLIEAIKYAAGKN